MFSRQKKSLQKANITELTKTTLSVSTLRVNNSRLDCCWSTAALIVHGWSCPSNCSRPVSDGQYHWSSDNILDAEENPKFSNPRDSDQAS